MSSFFGVVAKQVKSHPAVSLSHSFNFYGHYYQPVTKETVTLKRAYQKLEAARAPVFSPRSLLNYLMWDQL